MSSEKLSPMNQTGSAASADQRLAASFGLGVVSQGFQQLQALVCDHAGYALVSIIVSHGDSICLLEQVAKITRDEGTCAGEVESHTPTCSRHREMPRFEESQDFTLLGTLFQAFERYDVGHTYSCTLGTLKLFTLGQQEGSDYFGLSKLLITASKEEV
jgi:hypothetical protein